MQHDLPPYIMKCLLLSGHDEKDVIQAMNTTENEGIIRSVQLNDILMRGTGMTVS